MAAIARSREFSCALVPVLIDTPARAAPLYGPPSTTSAQPCRRQANPYFLPSGMIVNHRQENQRQLRDTQRQPLSLRDPVAAGQLPCDARLAPTQTAFESQSHP